jgi:hypothetical protein
MMGEVPVAVKCSAKQYFFRQAQYFLLLFSGRLCLCFCLGAGSISKNVCTGHFKRERSLSFTHQRLQNKNKTITYKDVHILHIWHDFHAVPVAVKLK